MLHIQERSEWCHESHDPVETGKFVDILICIIRHDLITIWC